MIARHRATGIDVPASEFRYSEVPGVHEWIGDELTVVSGGWLERHSPVAGRFLLPEVALLPGENRLVARATDPETGLTSEDSEVVLVTVPENAFPNLVITASGWLLAAGPGGRSSRLGSGSDREPRHPRRRRDRGRHEHHRPRRAGGGRGPRRPAALESGASVEVLLEWTPTVAGPHRVTVDADPDGRVREHDENDNRVEDSFLVAGGGRPRRHDHIGSLRATAPTRSPGSR